MRLLTLGLFLTLLAASGIVAFNIGPIGSAKAVPDPEPPTRPGRSLKPFRSEAELTAYLSGLKKKTVDRRKDQGASNAAAPTALSEESKSPAKPSDSEDDSITNNQHAGVDEGGIVKLHGDYLVVLRRGRLFTVLVGDDRLNAVSVADAFGGQIDPNGTWYDEMLVSGNTIAVIGYSYSRGGTEIGLFTIDDKGKLTYGSTYHLRSNDYYSSRNYASRMIGGKLVFYTPYYLPMYGEDVTRYFPAVRKWHNGAKDDEFVRIIPATQIYNGMRENENVGQLALHTVTACDIDGGSMNCTATGVIGPAGSVFYVSEKNVYVWATDWYGNRESSMLYNMPLDRTNPKALAVTGSPVDQFSFLEDEEGTLNVLVRANSTGAGMWRSEVTSGDVALLQVPADAFADCGETARVSFYRSLPKPTGYSLQNRFVGDYLLYGTGSGYWNDQRTKGSTLYVVDRKAGETSQIGLPHGVDRIEALGSDAIVVGTSGSDLNFSTVKLGSRPRVADRSVMKDASQGELRSHGFFYKPDGKESGILGLPVSQSGRAGYDSLQNGSASITFFRNESLRLKGIGELNSSKRREANDHCRASCVDWYGNARPIFARGRIFALLGYEIVEGVLDDGDIYEKRRINFTPFGSRFARQTEE